jgi:hypothetical protein
MFGPLASGEQVFVRLVIPMSVLFFKISQRSVIPGEWGDYGHILQHGMSTHRSRIDGDLALERTGPYIPPITFPGIGEIVLNSSAKQLLETSTLSGFTFRPVQKVLVVELHWHNWDLNAEEPAFYAESGEPEDYILGQRDSEIARAGLGDLWELCVPITATVLRDKEIVSSYEELRLDLTTWNGKDLIRSDGYGSMLFSERARDWFSTHWPEYIEFQKFPTI